MLVAGIRRLQTNSLFRHVISGTIWLTLGTVFARALILLGIMAVSRLLGKETFGQFAIVQSTVVTVAVFAGLGLGSTVTRHIAQMRDNDIRGLSRLMTMTGRLVFFSGLALSVLLVVCAPYIAHNVLNAPEMSGLLAVASLSMLFNILFGYFNAALVGFEAIKQSALAQVSAAAISIPVLIALTCAMGLPGAIGGLILQAFLLSCVSFIFYRGQRQKWGIKSDKSFGHAEYKVLWTYSLPAFIFNLMVMPAHWASQATLFRSEGGTVEMATIGAGMQWYFALMFLPSVAARVFFPALSKIMATDDQANALSLLRFSFLSNALSSIPFAALIAFVSPFVMSLYGPGYENDWPVLALFVAASVVAILVLPFNLYVVASGNVWKAAAVNFIWAATYISLTNIWIDKGAMALAYAIVIAHFVQLALMGFLARLVSRSGYG